ncbi:hypothetical protein JXA80_14280 [bacterium]|nr:hypothetical protein [candidate division CSSED10-310 bacterium]
MKHLFTVCLWIMVGMISGLSPAAAQGIVIDHTCTDISQIPATWIEAAKQLTLHYAHTSHGSQVISGALTLESLDGTYAMAVREASSMGLPTQTTPPSIRIWDGTVGTTYVTPGLYWDSESGRATTRSIAATGDYDFSMWSFCGELSWQSTAWVQSYLDTMAQFESEFPGMRFILMTGHTDGTGETGTLNQNNNLIRQFAIDHDMVLFDFADIESWNPDGVNFLPLGCNDAGDYNNGNWCDQWCDAHPGHDLCTFCSCAHSTSLICNLKGWAFWWMMARLAGWNGLTECINSGDVDANGSLTANDAQLAFFITLGLYSPTAVEGCAADCDGNQSVTAGDAQSIFFAVLGIGSCVDPV